MKEGSETGSLTVGETGEGDGRGARGTFRAAEEAHAVVFCSALSSEEQLL